MWCTCRTFSLSGRAVRVAQREERHLDQLVEEHVLSDQHEFGVLFPAVEVYRALIVLDHAEHGQHVT